MDRKDVQPPVGIVPADPGWPARFESEAGRIRRALPSATRIDHVGSTAVADLAAKPVVDIQVSVPQLHPLGPIIEALASIGYTHRPSLEDRDYPFFHLPSRWPHEFHAHVCEAGGREERRTLAFRDYLRDHPDTSAAYEHEKRRLAACFDFMNPEAREAYAEAKTAFIEPVVERALELGYPRRAE